MTKLKLSELPDDVEVSVEESHTVYTVAELKREITELGEPHHESSNWYTIKRQRWQPSAKSMIEHYIECIYDEMYEDWDERAWECIKPEQIERIQAVLDEAFDSDYATAYWTYDKPVEIDIFPPDSEKSA
jgi:hypothetical protein